MTLSLWVSHLTSRLKSSHILGNAGTVPTAQSCLEGPSEEGGSLNSSFPPCGDHGLRKLVGLSKFQETHNSNEGIRSPRPQRFNLGDEDLCLVNGLASSEQLITIVAVIVVVLSIFMCWGHRERVRKEIQSHFVLKKRWAATPQKPSVGSSVILRIFRSGFV
jgi:hypothetical protein